MADEKPKKDKKNPKSTPKAGEKKPVKSASSPAEKAKTKSTAQGERKAKKEKKTKPTTESTSEAEPKAEAAPNRKVAAAPILEAEPRAKIDYGWTVPSKKGTIEELLAGGAALPQETRDLLEAAEKLNRYMRDPGTVRQAHAERLAGQVGPEEFKSAFVGLRLTGGKLTAERCVIATVRRKEDDTAMLCDAVRMDKLPARLGFKPGVTIDVVAEPGPVKTMALDDPWVTIDLSALASTLSQRQPLGEGEELPEGYTIGAFGDGGLTGTFGALVKKNGDGKRYILSNNHVLAKVSGHVNGSAHGSSTTAGERRITHPGPADKKGGTLAQVGVLTDANQLLLSTPGLGGFPHNTMDAALAEGNNVQVNMALIEGFIQPAPLSFPVADGTRVQKAGRTTDLTFGVIHGIGETGPIGYKYGPGANDLAYGTFGSVYRILGTDTNGTVNGSAFSKPGDSGSVVMTLDANPKAVALLFAGSQNATYAIPMDRVFDELHIERFLQQGE